MSNNTNNAKIDVLNVDSTDKNLLAKSFEEIVKLFCIQNDFDTVDVNVVGMGVKVAFKDFHPDGNEDMYLLLQSYGKYGAMNIGMYNPKEKAYGKTSFFFEGLTVSNVGLMPFDDTQEGDIFSELDGFSQGFNNKFAHVTGYTLCRVVTPKQTKPATAKPTSFSW